MKYHNRTTLNVVPSRIARTYSKRQREILERGEGRLVRIDSLEKSKKEASKPLYLFRYE